MGLIKAALGSAGGVLADQWKEYFYCDSMAANVLVTKGKKRTSSRNSNTKGSDNIISNGSVIAVNEGQCMMIVEQGKIVSSPPRRANTPGIPPANPPFSRAVWKVWKAAGKPSSAASPSVEIPPRISGCTSST